MRSVIFCCFSMFSFLFGEPQAIYLTLPDDPAHAMSIHWIEKKQKGTFNTLSYRKAGSSQWKKTAPSSSQILGGSSYVVKECLLENLEASTDYFFSFEGEKKEFFFHTLPSELTSQIKIAIGGDFFESTFLFRKMTEVASRKNPDFVVLGGDIAYACGKGIFTGKHGSIKKWVDFFTHWQAMMRGDNDRLIPVVAVVGNHDVTPTDRKEKGENALFLKFFPSEQRLSYKTLDISGFLSLFLLDSGHLFPINKEQERWLEKKLRQKENISWKLPVYHIAGYPSIYSLDSKVPSQLRQCWSPLFEKYGVELVFEHHNHAFKRTYPMLDGQINPKGIVYIGDGCWGVSPRKVDAFRSYLEKSEASNCFSLLTVGQTFLKVEVFNEKNELIDKLDLTHP